jgi:type VI secretion system protein VasJ
MASMSENLKEAGATPLSADVPDPGWVRDESPEFARINAEIAKFESLSVTEEPDWLAVINIAGELVRSKSKDLLAISYMCRALFERERYAGLAVGLQILHDVIEQHWEIAYPPVRRAKRRGNEIAWMIDKLVNPVTQIKPETNEGDDVIRATSLLLGLEDQLRATLEDNAPIFRELRDVLIGYRDEIVAAQEQREAREAKRAEEGVRRAEEQARPQASPGPEGAPDTGTVPLAAGSSGRPVAAAVPVTAPSEVSVGSETDLRKAVRETQLAVRQIAAYRRSQKLSDPRPYAILRFAAWMDVAAAPQIPLPGPTKNMVAESKRLLDQGNHRELIEYVENLFLNPDAPANCHWLDCHRYTATALAALGDEYQGARDAVIRALRYYLATYPGTLDMSFTTEVEYADAQTKAWLRAEVLNRESEAVSGAAPRTGGSDLQVAMGDAVQTARSLAAKGDSRAAVGVFQQRLAGAASGREAFALVLEQSRLCIELGYLEVAASLLWGLCKKTDYYHLDEWEPDLSVETISLLLETLGQSKVADQARLAELRSRLARLDAVAAMETLRPR